jgi:hypothetical protein
LKYQGFIKKIITHKDEPAEVQAQFHDNFNHNYTGQPLVIQFCLGRMTYKRQHFAVHIACDVLREHFLFPPENAAIQAPRIPFFEDDEEEEDWDEAEEEETDLVRFQ